MPLTVIDAKCLHFEHRACVHACVYVCARALAGYESDTFINKKILALHVLF